MVNLPKARKLLEQLQAALDKLRILAGFSEEDFVKDFTKINSAKYLLQTAIESCINLGNHIISSGKYRAPEDYADVFMVLAENEILHKEFVVPMQKMTRFRNRIVHVYWDVDDRMIYDFIGNNLGDFEEFIRQIAKCF